MTTNADDTCRYVESFTEYAPVLPLSAHALLPRQAQQKDTEYAQCMGEEFRYHRCSCYMCKDLSNSVSKIQFYKATICNIASHAGVLVSIVVSCTF